MMPADLVKRIDLDRLYPPFMENLLALLAACRAKGADYYALEGFRSYEKSQALYIAYKKGGPKAAPAGASAHNFGLACDLALDSNLFVPGLQPAWRESDYDVAIAEARSRGFDVGVDYGDKPHFGYKGYVNANQLKPLAEIFEKTAGTDIDKLKAVWQYLDAHQPPGV